MDLDHTAHLVTDGSADTYWQSAGEAEASITLELGEICSVDEMTLQWKGSLPSSFRVEAFDEGSSSWRVVHRSDHVAADTQSLPVKRLRTARLRVSATPSIPSDGVTLREFEVWSLDAPRGQSAQPPVQAEGSALLDRGWMLQSASFTTASAEQISSAEYIGADWLPALVPGTVLSSYLHVGAVPDPFYANQQTEISEAFFTGNDFWYRNIFLGPPDPHGRLWLVFEGINWKADVYLNSRRLGAIEGAFIRGRFEITKDVIRGRENCLAVLVHKVDHPGPVQQKRLGGNYENGGILGLDSPTFVASIGWNWLPTIRGRNTGIWNDVHFERSRDITLDDPWVTSELREGASGAAHLSLCAELTNHSMEVQVCTLRMTLEGNSFAIPFTLQPKETRSVVVTAEQCPELLLKTPRLWWPNGYGEAALYQMHVIVDQGGTPSAQATVTFGVRELRYDTQDGKLTLLVNGHRMLCRGGNWGMDEGLLRCDEEGYELRVRMHRDMNLNMIRNWVGMVGREAFYEACDRHGILVWDDFWLANPSDGPDPADPAMFLANARDKIRRVRRHPCLALYCGRNEGDPPAIIDQGLRDAVATLDGTRFYLPASASGLVTGHGPYDNQEPAWYFEHRGITFHSEQGIVCVPPVESMRAMLPEPQLWPINDLWAVHDYQKPRSALYTQRMEQRYGPATDIDDYCRKAQMINLETAKAIFECLSAHQGSGMLIWMTQAAWPALICQLYDYYFEQTGAYFGAKSGAEPVHILWDQHAQQIKIANNTTIARPNLRAEAWLHDMHGRLLWKHAATVSCPSTSTTDCFALSGLTDEDAPVFLKLTLSAGQQALSENFYWSVGRSRNCQALQTLPQVRLTVQGSLAVQPGSKTVSVKVTNNTDAVALAIRLKLVHAASNTRVLPAFYEDNYFSLLPGDSRKLSISIPDRATPMQQVRLQVGGWNIITIEVELDERKQ